MPSQLQGRAKASREDDKRKILHLIAGTPEEVWKNTKMLLEADPLFFSSDHDPYRNIS